MWVPVVEIIREMQTTVSPLQMNLQVANFPRCKLEFSCPIMEVHSRVWHAFSNLGILYEWLCLTVQYCIEHSNTVFLFSTVSLFQAQDVWKQV